MLDFQTTCNEIEKDHKKVFKSGVHTLKWLYDGIYIVTLSEVPASIKISSAGKNMIWKEKRRGHN